MFATRFNGVIRSKFYCGFQPPGKPLGNDLKDVFMARKDEFRLNEHDSIWMLPKIVVPQTGWFIMENPIKTDDLGGTPIFGNTHFVSVKTTRLPLEIGRRNRIKFTSPWPQHMPAMHASGPSQVGPAAAWPPRDGTPLKVVLCHPWAQNTFGSSDLSERKQLDQKSSEFLLFSFRKIFVGSFKCIIFRNLICCRCLPATWHTMQNPIFYSWLYRCHQSSIAENPHWNCQPRCLLTDFVRRQ